MSTYQIDECFTQSLTALLGDQMDWFKDNASSLLGTLVVVVIASLGVYNALKDDQTALHVEQTKLNTKLELIIPYVKRFDSMQLSVQQLKDENNQSKMLLSRFETLLTETNKVNTQLLKTLNMITTSQAVLRSDVDNVKMRIDNVEKRVKDK